MTNSSVSGSYVAVVPMDATSEPCPISVIAKAPGSSSSITSLNQASQCFFVPSW